MSTATPWAPLEGSVSDILAQLPLPFPALATGAVPAVIVRGGFPEEACRDVVRRLYHDAGIEERPDGAYDAVGTSLVNRGADRDAFFRSAAETRALFARVFEGVPHPVDYLYRTLQALAPDRTVKVAQEPDGSVYGPGIFRLYPAGKGHVPHFDSIRLREQWTHYQASRFQYQFAGVLCLQATDDDPEGGECILHRHFWSPDLQPVLDEGEFGAFARERHIESTRIRLEAGDFYVFNPLNIHEVPLIRGNTARIVLATFLGFSPDDPEVYVWS